MARTQTLALGHGLERMRGVALWTLLASATTALDITLSAQWTLAPVAIALLLRMFVAWRKGLPAWWSAVALTAFVVTWNVALFRFGGVTQPAALATLATCVAVMLCVRSTRAGDRVLCVLGVGAMAGAALTGASVWFAPLLLLFAIAGVTLLATSELLQGAALSAGESQHAVRGLGLRLSTMVALATVAIVLLTAAIFFVLPRTARAALRRFGPLQNGVSPTVDLSRTGRLVASREPVFHVRFDNDRARTNLYWRTGALVHFNGKSWSATSATPHAMPLRDSLVQLVSDDQRRKRGERFIYEVSLDRASEELPLAGLAENVRADLPALAYDHAGTLRVPFGADAGLRYIVYSYTDGDGRAQERAGLLNEDERALYTRLPLLDARVGALALEWTRSRGDRYSKAEAVAHELHARYGYTLDGPARVGDDPTAEFLFERRAGHCEQFASTMAVMLRWLGVPSRVAVGYLGGEVNPLTHAVVVRASDAHAWVEAFIDGRGWVRFDPTPATRIDAPGGLNGRLEMLADSVLGFWQQWVVGYDVDSQMTLAFRLDQARRGGAPWFGERWYRLKTFVTPSGSPGPALGQAMTAVALGLGLLCALAAAWLWRQRRSKGKSDRRESVEQRMALEATELYRQMLDLLARRGVHKPGFLTPAEFARTVAGAEFAPELDAFTSDYHALRFGHDAGATSRMRAALQRLGALH